MLGREAATLVSTEFRARNHAALEHIDLVVSHGSVGVLLSSTRLRQRGLIPTLRKDQSGKRALETLIPGSPPAHRVPRTMPLDQ